MKKISKIIYGLDMNHFSKKTLDYAVEQAKTNDAQLIIIFAHQMIPHIVSVSLPKNIIEESVKGFKKQLVELCENNISENIKWEAVVLEEKTVYEAIINAAKKLNADLIIVSAHDRHELDQIFLGHNTEKIVRYAPCSVYVSKD